MVEVWAWVAVASMLAYLILAARRAGKNRQALATVPRVPPGGPPSPTADGSATPTSVLLWRATWVPVLIRSVVLVLLGLTPLGVTLIHSISPAGETLRSFAACVLIVLIVWAPALLARQLRTRALALSPELRLEVGRRERIRQRLAPAFLLCIGAWFLCSDLTLFFAWCVELVVVVGILLWLLDESSASEVTSSPALLATLKALPYPTQPGLRIIEGYPGKVQSLNPVDICIVSDSKYSPAHIVVSPRAAEVFSSRELTAALGHEVAHVERRDRTVGRRRSSVVVAAVVASAVGSNALAGLRAVAGVPQTLGAESLPLMLVSGYAVFRLLHAIDLGLSRGAERCCDVRMLALCQDREAAVAALTVLQHHLLVPATWTRAQRLLMATHPAMAERLWLLAHAPIPAPFAVQ